MCAIRISQFWRTISKNAAGYLVPKMKTGIFTGKGFRCDL